MLKKSIGRAISIVFYVYAAVVSLLIIASTTYSVATRMTCSEQVPGKIVSYEQSQYQNIMNVEGSHPVINYSVDGKDYEYVSGYPQYIGEKHDGMNVTVKYDPGAPQTMSSSSEMISVAVFNSLRALLVIALFVVAKFLFDRTGDSEKKKDKPPAAGAAS